MLLNRSVGLFQSEHEETYGHDATKACTSIHRVRFLVEGSLSHFRLGSDNYQAVDHGRTLACQRIHGSVVLPAFHDGLLEGLLIRADRPDVLIDQSEVFDLLLQQANATGESCDRQSDVLRDLVDLRLLFRFDYVFLEQRSASSRSASS